MAHRASLGTSTHLLSLVLVLMTTIIKCRLSFSKLEATQGPAAGVHPGFTPLNPLLSNEFPLFQMNSLGWSYWSRPMHSYLTLLQTSLMIGSYIEIQDNFPISAAVDLLFVLPRPCAFAKLVDSRPKARAYLFISWIKYLILYSWGSILCSQFVLIPWSSLPLPCRLAIIYPGPCFFVVFLYRVATS